MINKEVIIRDATCDGCRKSLISETPPGNANFGLLKSSFGFGSPLDDMGDPNSRHLCEKCWTKALAAVGLKP